MDDEYTPTTHQIRIAYSYVDGSDTVPRLRGEAFDRWLAAHDREVVEAVVVRIAESVQNHWRNP